MRGDVLLQVYGLPFDITRKYQRTIGIPVRHALSAMVPAFMRKEKATANV
jgi:hypothetical protein